MSRGGQPMHRTVSCSWITLLLLLGVSEHSLSADLAPSVVGKGALRSVNVLPEKVVLRGAEQVQQLVATGTFANGGLRDLTSEAVYRVADAAVARVEAGGLLVAVKTGRTEVTVAVQGRTVT